MVFIARSNHAKETWSSQIGGCESSWWLYIWFDVHFGGTGLRGRLYLLLLLLLFFLPGRKSQWRRGWRVLGCFYPLNWLQLSGYHQPQLLSEVFKSLRSQNLGSSCSYNFSILGRDAREHLSNYPSCKLMTGCVMAVQVVVKFMK